MGKKFFEKGGVGGMGFVVFVGICCPFQMVNVTRDQYLQNFFRIHNLKTKQKLLLFSSHILSLFSHYQFTSWMKRARERERESERYLNNFKLFWCKQTREEVPSSSSWFLKSILWR
jgi:hypothetical protein